MNVVLFHKAARVEALDIPQGTEIRASTGHSSDEVWEEDYSVIEKTPPLKPPPEKKDDDGGWPALHLFAASEPPAYDYDDRDTTLRIDPGSVEVHTVQRVAFETEDQVVRRHRWEKRDPKF